MLSFPLNGHIDPSKCGNHQTHNNVNKKYQKTHSEVTLSPTLESPSIQM